MLNKNGEIRKNAWTEEELALLGKYTDKEVSEKIGKKKNTVSSYRMKLGILPKFHYKSCKLKISREPLSTQLRRHMFLEVLFLMEDK